jgi:hypothetical protein
MALTKFTPDPDLFDPEDDEAWYGTWQHDDGSSLYGQGDPEMGRELLAANDAPPASPYGQQNMTPAQPPPESREVLDAGAPMPPRGLDPTLQAQSIGQPPPSIARPPEAPEASPDWADDIPPALAMSLEQQASDAGLNPAALAATIKHESGWDPSKGSGGDAGKDVHAGLIQFSKKLWPGVAAAAGQPDVTFEEMRAMSAEEQVPFVIAYYKGKGLTPQSSPGDYRLATYKPAHLDKGDDFELDNAADTKGIPVDAKNARLDRNGDGVINSYEQNAGLDTNRDGLITTGEVRGGPGGQTAPGMPGMAPRGTMPGSIGGLPIAEVQQQGIPLTPEQVQQRQGDVAQRYAAVAGMQQMAQQERIRGREEVQQEWMAAHEQQGKDAQAELAKQAAIAAEAQQKIDQEVNQPIQKVDPRRYITEMSTGAAVLGAIGVVLAGLGQAKAMSMGMNPGSNSGVDALNKAIDQDVQLQREDIAQGRERSSNRIAHWSRILGNAEQGERAARAEAKTAAAGMLQAKAMKSDIAEIRAGGMQQAAALFAQGQQEIQAIADETRKGLTARYAIPAPRAGVDPVKAQLERVEAAKKLRQEYILAGRTPEQADEALARQGLPSVQGETVDQAKHKADQKHQDEQMDTGERAAEAAHATLGAYAQSTPLKRDPESGKWTVPEDAGIGWKLENRKARQATRMAAIESFGRMESGGVIGPEEEERFAEMLGGWDTTLDELAENLNAIERIIQAKRNQTRAGGGSVPGNWK